MCLNIKQLKKSKDLALLLGMFASDGCLSIKHNGKGYRDYPIGFYNTNQEYVKLFHKLFYELFKIDGNISCRKRENKKDLWEFLKHSVKIYKLINQDFEIYCGKKALNVRIPSFILTGTKKIKKHFFLGLLITDGGIRKKGGIIFHLASEGLLLDLKQLIKEVWGFDKPIKHYIQREKFHSFQLNLNKKESHLILTQMPPSHNLVLR